MKKDDRITEAGTTADSDMQPIELPSASIEANPLLNAVPFTLDDVEDVRVIIKAKGKHYGLVPKRDACTEDEAKEIRIGLLSLLTTFHYVVDKALEDLSA